MPTPLAWIAHTVGHIADGTGLHHVVTLRTAAKANRRLARWRHRRIPDRSAKILSGLFDQVDRYCCTRTPFLKVHCRSDPGCSSMLSLNDLEGFQRKIGRWLNRWFETEDRPRAIGTLARGVGRSVTPTAAEVRAMYAAGRINASEYPLGVRGGPMPRPAPLVQVALTPKTVANMDADVASTIGMTRTSYLELAATMLHASRLDKSASTFPLYCAVSMALYTIGNGCSPLPCRRIDCRHCQSIVNQHKS